MSPHATETPLATSAQRASSASTLAFESIVSLRTGRCWAVEPSAVALDESLPAWARGPSVGLSLHVDERAIPTLDAELAALGDALDRRGLARGRVIVEPIERGSGDIATLVELAKACRAHGFLVATAEVGVGHPHIARIVGLEPDLLKIDARLFAGVAGSTPRLEACRALVELARSLGAIIVARDIVAPDDLVELAMLGIDLFQGPLIGPRSVDIHEGVRVAESSIDALRARLRSRAEREVMRRRKEREAHERVFVTVMSRIAQARSSSLDEMASQIARDVEGLEALYVLDHLGVQRTRTWLGQSLAPRSGFEPAERGADLALKDYFLEVTYGTGAYVSRPYVSMASGRICVTHSRRLRLCDGTNVVVCCDVPK